MGTPLQVREVEHDEEADAAPKSRRKFPLFPLFREPMMAICPHGMNTRAAVPCSCGANATRSVAIPWEGGEKGGKENAAGISKLSLIGSMLVVTSGGPTGLVSEAREVRLILALLVELILVAIRSSGLRGVWQGIHGWWLGGCRLPYS